MWKDREGRHRWFTVVVLRPKAKCKFENIVKRPRLNKEHFIKNMRGRADDGSSGKDDCC